LSIVNKIKLLGKEFPYSRLIEKIMVTVLERYDWSIASLENTKDLSTITLVEVIHALQAQEQPKLMREDHEVVEGNFNYTKVNALIVKNNKRSKYNNTRVMSSNFFPHLIFKFGDLIEFSVLKDWFN